MSSDTQFDEITGFIKHGDVVAFKAAIDNGYNVNSAEPNEFGSSLLQIAIRYGQMEIFNFLLEKGADINFVDRVGWTPLMECVVDSKPEFAKVLIEKGADKSIANHRGATAGMLAQKFGQHAISQML
jgi:ankyrin repeat protein